jgi:hypothetical protein
MDPTGRARVNGFWARLLARLESPRMPLVAAAVAFALALPTVALGYFLDDRYHELVMRGLPFPGGAHGVWDLYRFADGGPAYREGLRSAALFDPTAMTTKRARGSAASDVAMDPCSGESA